MDDDPEEWITPEYRERVLELYNDPETGLMGISTFARRHHLDIRKVRAIVSNLDAYNVARIPRKVFPRRITYTPNSEPFSILQMDLQVLEQPEMVRANDGVRYLLTVVDQASRFAFIRPMKTKSSAETTRELEDILNSIPRRAKVKAIFTDEGTEFLGATERMLKERGIEHWESTSDIGASIVERFNLTFKLRLNRYLTAKESFRYIDDLQSLVDNYNNTFHRGIGMTPTEGTTNQKGLEENYERKVAKQQEELREQEALKVGTYVKIANPTADRFTKAIHDRLTTGVYRIARVEPTFPYTYRIETLGNPPEILRELFYEEQLFVVEEPKTFQVREIKKYDARKKLYYVSWQGYPDNEKYNTWENEDSLPEEYIARFKEEQAERKGQEEARRRESARNKSKEQEQARKQQEKEEQERKEKAQTERTRRSHRRG